ncbi:hypothetical protein [Rhizosaccharibacter radicis]|uniref:SRP54-type proteins GTP-binding domain-containing protein n=1 Tax=Rhizosaccharibacter radicis TaxID=2782605 RepID=A0ABT1VSS4_9PROT|nr:hypothetical protein [Acetobacteraceae bacterium KSS12]
MRIKVFRGRTVAEAMRQVRDVLGDDALILNTATSGGQAEVTATGPDDGDEPEPLPRFTESADDGADPGAFGVPRDTLARLASPGEGFASAASLAWHGVPARLLTEQDDLLDRCRRLFRFGRLPLESGSAPLLLAGPPGAGKTLATARLAARLVMEGRPPLVVTADEARAGAVEQLAAFTRLLGLTLVAAGRPQTLRRVLGRRDTDLPVLVDMPGLDPADVQDEEMLRELLGVAECQGVLVMPTGLDPGEAGDLACRHARLGIRYLMPTRLEAGRRLGGLLSAAEAARLVLVEGGHGRGVADGLVTVTPQLLASRLAHASSVAALPPLLPKSRPEAEPETAERPFGSGTIFAESSHTLSAHTDRPGARRPPTHSVLSLHIAAQRRTASEDVP